MAKKKETTVQAKSTAAKPVVVKNEACDCAKGTCKCGPDCNCTNECSGKTKLMIKSGVILASAILISGAILTAGLDNGCGRGKFFGEGGADKPMPAKFMEKRDAAMRDFIMKNPKVLIESVDAYYKAQQAGAQGAADCGDAADAVKPAPQKAPELQAAPADLVAKIVADKSNHVLGNPKGKFVIIEFFDYQCGWCKKTNKEMGLAVKSTNNIRWILIDTPIFGPASETIARYGMAAAKQGKFAQMHEALTNASGRLDEAALKKMGADLGMDVKKLEKDANSDEIKAKLAANQALARQLNINGVPMLIVDGKINPGALIGPRLQEAVKAANAKK